jgi:hypothetical protein
VLSNKRLIAVIIAFLVLLNKMMRVGFADYFNVVKEAARKVKTTHCHENGHENNYKNGAMCLHRPFQKPSVSQEHPKELFDSKGLTETKNGWSNQPGNEWVIL